MGKTSNKIAAKADRSTPVSPMTPSQQQPRRKATVTKAWLVVLESGVSRLEEVGKQSIMRRTGLPARDLRILDPLFSYPSTVLGRERAIVVNLEHIKAIITAQEVLVLSSNNPQVAAFVEDLQYHLLNHNRTPRQAAESSDIEIGATNKSPWGSTSFLSLDESESPSPRKEVSIESSAMIPETKDCSPESTLDVPKGSGTTKLLPFEFRVLEVCLQCACKCLESETSLLEKEAYPALDELTSKISTLNLERVRQIKNRLVTISGRVQKVRDELEHLLDDDMDMVEMHLTNEVTRQQLEETSSAGELDDDELDVEDERHEDSKNKARSSYGSSAGSKPNIEELEMLLEAYFTQIEGTLSKLSTLREYVDDTEDYINIMLDEKQNQLLQMGVLLSTATLVISMGVVVAGVMGMNVRIDLFNNGTQTQFLETTAGIVAGCLILYVMAIGFGKKTGLLA